MLLALCDLDGTFIQTSRHIAESVPTNLVYTSSTNKKLVMTNKQLNLFNFLNSNGIVIPVTARSLDSLQRLSSHMSFNHFKICDHGALIYDKDNKLVEDYADYMTELLTPIQDSMYAVSNCLNLFHNNRIFAKLKTRSVALIETVVLIEGTAETEAHANIIVSNLEKLNLQDIYISRNGKSFSVTAFSNSYKQLACQYLIENVPEYQDLPTLGFGDSISDLSFMFGCDFSVVPNTDSTQISIV